MNSDQLYANGRIAVMSTRLLTQDKFIRLAECNSLAEALKVLYENGYGNGVTVSNPNDYEQILRAELDSAMALLKELCYDKNALRYLLCKYDYINAKTLMKGKYLREDFTSYCFEQAHYSPQQMQEAFVNDTYSAFTKAMAEACDGIDLEYANGNRSPQIIDKLLDRASYKDMRSYAKRASSRLIYKLYDWQLNTTNLMLLYRFKKAGYDKDTLADWLIDGGTIKRDTLLKLWDSDATALDLPERYRKFYALCNEHNTSLIQAEREQIAERSRLIAEYADFLTIQPALDYFYKKVDETEKVRRVLVDVKNGVDKDKIKDKLK